MNTRMIQFALKRPLSLIAAVSAVLLILYQVIQISGGTFTTQVIDIDLTYDMNYLLNRSTKLAMFLAYVTLFPLWKVGKNFNNSPDAPSP